jgi:hypothetical protein
LKSGSCSNCQQELHRLLSQLEPDTPEAGTAWVALRYGVAAYLALENTLVMANDHSLFDRLLLLSEEEFHD